MQRKPVIQVEHLRKVYGSTVAVDDVSFEVYEGEIFGMVGPNGAGKTTTIECIEGLRQPDGGHIQVLGLDPLRDGYALRLRIGIQLQESALQDRLKVWEVLDLFASFYPRVAAFFTLVFPLMMLFLFGSIYGNEPTPFFGGYGSVDISVPAYTAMIIATSGLLSLPITIATYRERGILRRLKATPVRPQTLLSAQLIVFFLMTALGMIFLVVAGKLVYGLRFDGNPLAISAAFVLSSLSFFALGFVLASLLPTARTAQIVAMVLFYPMIFLSGATLPREILPEGIRQVALPLSHVVTLLRGLWIGNSWEQHLREVGILAGLLIVGILISSKTFRWE